MPPAVPRTLLGLSLLAAACQASPPRMHGRSLESLPVLIPPPWFALIEGTGVPEQGHIDFAFVPESDLVQLVLRPSFFARRVAVHPYFRVYRSDPGRWDQWEVWAGDLQGWRESTGTVQRKASDGRKSEDGAWAERQHGTIRHWENMVYIDGHDPQRVRAVWTGDRARKIIEVLERPTDYPWVDSYRIWPGPNSNTYAAWVLREAGVALDLGPRMVGKDWGSLLGAGVGLSPTRTGLRLDLPGVGAAVGLGDGVELHLLGATVGIDLVPPALKTPFGRLGFPLFGSLWFGQ